MNENLREQYSFNGYGSLCESALAPISLHYQVEISEQIIVSKAAPPKGGVFEPRIEPAITEKNIKL
jgi:hypothetical protein